MIFRWLEKPIINWDNVGVDLQKNVVNKSLNNLPIRFI